MLESGGTKGVGARTFHLPWRQTEGFVKSLLHLMGLDRGAPDHTMLSRRGRSPAIALRTPAKWPGPIHLIVDSTGLEVVGQGQLAAAKRAGKGVRGWRIVRINRIPQVHLCRRVRSGTGLADCSGRPRATAANVSCEPKHDFLAQSSTNSPAAPALTKPARSDARKPAPPLPATILTNPNSTRAVPVARGDWRGRHRADRCGLRSAR